MSEERAMFHIPVAKAQEIAELYGYDQMIILGRQSIDGNLDFMKECVTTFGVSDEHRREAAEFGSFLKYDVLGWEPASETVYEDEYGLIKKAHERYG